jgi:hypothetical protein
MANTKVKDLVVKLREYTDAQGNKKAMWHNIGSVMRGDDGNEFLMLDRHFNPAGLPNPDNRSNVIVSMFDANRDKGGNGGSAPPAQGGAPAGGRDYGDEIPFAPEYR